MYTYLSEINLSLLWCKYVEVDLLRPITDYFTFKILYLIPWVTLYYFSEWQYHFTPLSVVHMGSNISISSPTLVLLFFFVFQYHSNPIHCEGGGNIFQDRLAGPRCLKKRYLWPSFLFTYYPSDTLANLNSSRQEAEVKKLEENQ